MEWILYTALAVLLSYLVVRLGVYHGVRDADRSWARNVERTHQESDEP